MKKKRKENETKVRKDNGSKEISEIMQADWMGV